MAKLTDKDIYSGQVNPLKDVADSAKTLLTLADQIIIKYKEVSKVLSTEISGNPKKTVENYKQLNTQTTELTTNTNKLKEVEKQRKLLQTQLTQAEDKNVKAKLKYNDAVRTQKKEITQLIKWQKAEKKSIDRLNAANAILRRRVRAVSSATEAGRKRILSYNKAIDRNTAKVTKLSDAQTRQFKGIGKYASAIKNAGAQLGLFTSGAILASTAIRALVGEIKDVVQVNRDWERSFTNVLTLLDEAQKNKFGDLIEKGNLDLMADYGFEIDDVNKALFDAISASIEAGESINFLDDNAKLAIGGVTDLGIATDGTTSILNAFEKDVSETTKVTSAFFSAQKAGKTTVGELATEVGKVAPLMQQAGGTYQEMLSILAEFTKKGLSTTDAVTALNSILSAVLKPGKEAEVEFNNLGIATRAVAVQSRGFVNVLGDISVAVDENADLLTTLIPQVRALKGAGALTEDALADLDKIIATVNEDYGEGSSLMQAYNEQMATSDRIVKKSSTSWKRYLITVGGGENIFKKVSNSLRKYVIKENDRASARLEYNRLQHKKNQDQISDEEYNEALKELAIRYGYLSDQIDKSSKASEVSETITKQQMLLIIEYNKELGKQLIFTKKNYDIAKKYYDELDRGRKEELITIKSLGEKIKELEEIRSNISSKNPARITELRQEIDELKKQKKALEDLGKEVEKGSLNALYTQLSELEKEKKSIALTDLESIILKEKEIIAIKEQIDLYNHLFKLLSEKPEDIDFTDNITIDDDSIGILKELSDLRLNEITDRHRTIEELENEHYDSLIGIFFNYQKRKIAADESLSKEERDIQLAAAEQQEEATQQLADTLLSIGNQLLDSKLNQIQSEIDAKNQQINEQEQAVNRELQLLQAGAANEYETEKEKLQKLQDQRKKDLAEKKKIQKQQQTINTLTQISELATAVAYIITSATAEMGWAGVVVGLLAAAAAVVGFTTYKNEAESAATAEEGGTFIAKDGSFIEKGNRHSKGGNTYDALNTESGELHGVLSRDATNKHGDLFQDLFKLANSDKLNPDELEMYRHSITQISPNNVIVNNNYSEMVKILNETNDLLRSKKGLIITPKGKMAKYDHYGELKNISV